jgi:hypothetical protein
MTPSLSAKDVAARLGISLKLLYGHVRDGNHAVGTALEPAHDNGALPQVDVIPAQIASL